MTMNLASLLKSIGKDVGIIKNSGYITKREPHINKFLKSVGGAKSGNTNEIKAVLTQYAEQAKNTNPSSFLKKLGFDNTMSKSWWNR